MLLNLTKLLLGKFWEITSCSSWWKLCWALWLSLKASKSTSILIEIWSRVRYNLIGNRCLLPLCWFYYLSLLLLWFKCSLFWFTHLDLWSHTLTIVSILVVDANPSRRKMVGWHLMMHSDRSNMWMLTRGMT